MQNETFKPGQELYLDNGYLVEYICRIDSGHIVCQVFEVDDEEEPYYGDPFFARQVFKSPPSARQEHRIADLESEIEEKKKELREVCSELWDAQNSQKKLVDVLDKNEALAQIENVMSGNITHYVSVNSGKVKVEAVNASRDRYSGPEFHLSIGLKNKSIKWGFREREDQWSDKTCFPFPNEFEAIEFAKKHILELADAPDLSYYVREDIIKSAAAFEVVLPDAIHQAHKTYLLESRTSVRDRAQAELDKATKALAELGGGDDAN